MAKKPSPLPTPASPNLSVPQMRSAVARFERRIKELAEFDPNKVSSRKDPTIDALEASISDALDEAFGHGTPSRTPYSAAATIDTARHSLVNETPLREVIEGLHHGKNRAITLLTQAAKLFEEKIAERESETTQPSRPSVATAPHPISNEIFLVHGRDNAAKIEVARIIERAGLEAIILHEQPNGGRTIIEKFEAHGGNAGFAIVIMTPDDVGGLDVNSLQPRARQNVIGEMFWFAGRLGRERVCALKKGLIEVPTDFAGVGYIDMDSSGAWKHEVLRELEHAGYKNLDWPKALS